MTISPQMNDKITSLKDKLVAAESSIKFLFTELKDGQNGFLNIFRRNFIKNYLFALDSILFDLDILADKPESGRRYYESLSLDADSVDSLNQLFIDCKGKSLMECLEEAVFDSLTLHEVMTNLDDATDDVRFFLQHGIQLCESVCAVKDYIDLLKEAAGKSSQLPRLRPGIFSILEGESILKLPEGQIPDQTRDLLKQKALKADPFSGGNAFRYLDGKFVAAELSNIRRADEFFGFNWVRDVFNEHFADFAEKKSNHPLLVCSLPGLGKTHFTISYTMKYENLCLILPEPEDLEKTLQGLIEKLANRKDRRFIIFFDDIEPAKVDWYYFRTNVGGSFSLPENVSVVIASNFEFPASILSRGRAVKFPMFDEIRCLEMIEEFLRSRGLKHRNPNLELVIAADYLEDFGQRKFEELSPRTLMRYLELYQGDMRRRKRMLEMTRMDVFSKPDPQIFYEFNIKLMRSLYGEEVIDALRDENLKQQLGTF